MSNVLCWTLVSTRTYIYQRVERWTNPLIDVFKIIPMFFVTEFTRFVPKCCFPHCSRWIIRVTFHHHQWLNIINNESCKSLLRRFNWLFVKQYKQLTALFKLFIDCKYYQVVKKADVCQSYYLLIKLNLVSENETYGSLVECKIIYFYCYYTKII